ncbi:hypothetical protein CK203_048032 [Vitis vinifera]|uniref:Transposon Ty3-I Gag-Pol polyprotein n=1 Tax=Vitis vinifera TaxID=29760 RepID=A0A438GYS0_VITVI|nr:hypothetical protein CK203_048032 [Vitis vinifera]
MEFVGKEEIQKQLSVGFLSVVEYPEWLANVVLVPKKTTSTAGHSMLSFMDGFSGYNQILMALEDMEKTSFITEWGTYSYRVMPFGLKNAGATYQRDATTLFYDMMHRDVEFRLRLNPKKCTFGVTSGNLLGHIVSRCGIEVDLEKIRAILDMPVRGLRKRLEAFLADYKFDIQYVTQKSVKWSIVADHLASLRISDDRPIDDDFPDEQFVSMTNIAGWRLYFDSAANQLGFGIGILLISPQGMHHRSEDYARPWSQTVGDSQGFQLGYSADSGFEELRYIHLPRVENQFANVLTTLASMIEIPAGVDFMPS